MLSGFCVFGGHKVCGPVRCCSPCWAEGPSIHQAARCVKMGPHLPSLGTLFHSGNNIPGRLPSLCIVSYHTTSLEPTPRPDVPGPSLIATHPSQQSARPTWSCWSFNGRGSRRRTETRLFGTIMPPYGKICLSQAKHRLPSYLSTPRPGASRHINIPPDLHLHTPAYSTRSTTQAGSYLKGAPASSASGSNGSNPAKLPVGVQQHGHTKRMKERRSRRYFILKKVHTCDRCRCIPTLPALAGSCL
ncbi:hypothetical protein MAPG_06825 [Magnaporthiopsis poae ATCC 64411]|uniref:Uncharacterized protein n=1 Tax=Magnaporthiopsis poae (strain ATCC 64411 / 73-15) TaxID=644358 RepID=A0A0C4E333_MAGP6|nr:hypothetical protein MAPG_06825 [Magnaporthiopsis poae ATCC 64411]